MTEKKTLSSTNYHFSLLADPEKIQQNNRPIIINNDSESTIDSAFNIIHSSETNVKWNENTNIQKQNNKKDKTSGMSDVSSSSSKSSNKHRSDNSTSNKSTTNKKTTIENNIHIPLNTNSENHKNNKYNTNKHHDTHNTHHDTHDTHNTHNTHHEKLNNEQNNSGNINGTNYMRDDDNYDILDDQKKLWKRLEIFARLKHYEGEKNIKLMKHYTIDSDYWEMKAELKYIVDKQNAKDAVEFGLSSLTWIAQGIEFLNKKYDPINVDLNGWGNHIKLTKNNYKDVFEQLYEKHKDKQRKIEPEIKLLGMIFFSGLFFHMSKNAANVSGLDAIIKNNPTLMSSLDGAMQKKIFAESKTPEQLQNEQNLMMFKQMQTEKNKQNMQQTQISTGLSNKGTTDGLPMQQTTNKFSGVMQNSLASAPFIGKTNPEINAGTTMNKPNFNAIIDKVRQQHNIVSTNLKNNIDGSDDIKISTIKDSRIEVTETLERDINDKNKESNNCIRSVTKQRELI